MATWKYVDNQFEVNTRRTYKKALILSNYHDAALQTQSATDAALLPLYTRYHPLHLEFTAQYNNWKSAGGAQQGQTLNLAQQLATTYQDLGDWALQIQVVYRKTTARYKAIFPNGRKPFTNGGLDDRINAYDTLSRNIGADAALAGIKTQIDAAYTTLDNARDTQEGAKSTKSGGSQQLNIDRIAAMDMQYRNMGFIINTFFEIREMECSILFDLATLRENDQKSFSSTLAPGETKAILVHTFLVTDLLKIKIDTNGPVSLFLADTAGGISSTPVVITSPAEVITPISAFGDIDLHTNRFLTAVNNVAAVITKLRVQIE